MMKKGREKNIRSTALYAKEKLPAQDLMGRELLRDGTCYSNQDSNMTTPQLRSILQTLSKQHPQEMGLRAGECVALIEEVLRLRGDGKMNIYRVSRPDSDDVGYDEYSEFVCVAESIEAAKKIHPDSCAIRYPAEFRQSEIPSLFWPVDPALLTVVCLGPSQETEPRVVCASFHAG